MGKVRRVRALVARIVEPRLARGHDILATALGSVIGVGVAAAVLICVLALCPPLLDAVFS